MNYLAHSLRFLDDPYALAGACLPDWLRVVDRRARVHVHALDATPPVHAHEVRLDHGVRAHHDDDLRFHTHATFEALTDTLVREVRALSDDPRFRASTIGHILAEMLLDAAILERAPTSGTRFYDALDELEGERIATFARERSGRPLPMMGALLRRFSDARFVLDYVQDEGVLRAMNGVLMRTGLPRMPDGFLDVVRAARPRVREAHLELIEAGILPRA
jgi:hypothetical protein